MLSEKLGLGDIENLTESELNKMFKRNILEQIDVKSYLNLRICQVFFNVFVEFTKNIENCLYLNKIKHFISTNGIYLK